MPLLLPAPEVQFCDSNGKPLARGTIAFYIWGTDTPKDTFADHDGTVLNENPLTLDSAGRALIFGSGDFRAVLKDSSGNLIYDQWTSSVVSDALQPVVRAATIAEAQALLGIIPESEILADINSAVAVETTRAEAAENTLTTNLAAEVARAEAEEAHLQAEIDAITGATPAAGGMRAGSATTDASGYIHVTFSPAFTTGLLYFTIMPTSGTLLTTGPQPPSGDPSATIINTTSVSTSGVTARIGADTGTGPPGYLPYGAGYAIGWFAIGY